MNIEVLLHKTNVFAELINSDNASAQKLDAELIEILGNDGRVVPQVDIPPTIQMLYAFNRAILRLNLVEIESAAIAMLDLAEIIRHYELWDEIYFILWLLAESKGKLNKFDEPLAYACDNLMMAIICQIKFPSISLSLFIKAESLYIKLGRDNTAVFVKGLKQLQYVIISECYNNDDAIGASLFVEKAKSMGVVNLRAFRVNEPNYSTIRPVMQECTTDEIRDAFIDSDEHIPTMNEWRQFWQKLPEYNINESLLLKKFIAQSIAEKDKLPNILEVLEIICYEEEKYALLYDKNPIGQFLNSHQDNNDLYQVTNSEGKLLFLPKCRVKHWYYRGQTDYHTYCQPSLYRKKDKFVVLIERLKLCEFSILIKKHPIASVFESGIYHTMTSGDVQHCKIFIDDSALAQHYGINTEFIDLTTDKWAAAFFASSTHVDGVDSEKETYKPYEGDKVGVFYVYQDKSPYVNQWKLHPVGIQPFSRPVRQSGYVLEVMKDQNFNELAFGILFRADVRCSSIIFKLFNESKGILPDELIEKKSQVIKNSNKFSRSALLITRQRFYSHLMDAQFDELVNGCNVEIVEEPIVEFQQNEIKEAMSEFEFIDKNIQFNTTRQMNMTIT